MTSPYQPRKRVRIVSAASNRYRKIVSMEKDGQPILTPFFEVKDNGSEFKEAAAWCRANNYQMV